MGYMTRRSFVRLGASAGGLAALAGTVGCGNAAQTSSPADSATEGAKNAVPSASKDAPSGVPQVYYTHALDSAGLQAVFSAIGQGLGRGRIGVKLSSGEPGGNHYLKADLIADLEQGLDRVG